MKWLFVTGLLLAVAVLGVGTAVAQFDYVDIGDPTSESTHNLVGWGPIEPAASGGNYGGIDDCRVVYASTEVPGENWATVDMNFGPAGVLAGKCLIVRHLDGQSGTDYFYVTVNGNYVGAHDDTPGGGEVWVLTEFNASGYFGVCTVKIVSTEPPWPQFHLYGQVAIDEITVGYCGPVALGETTWGRLKTLYR